MLVVDTGPLVATADRADKDHATCRALLEGDEGPLVTTALVRRNEWARALEPADNEWYELWLDTATPAQIA